MTPKTMSATPFTRSSFSYFIAASFVIYYGMDPTGIHRNGNLILFYSITPMGIGKGSVRTDKATSAGGLTLANTHRSGGSSLPLVQKYHILRGVESAKPIQSFADHLVLAKLLGTHDGVIYSNGNRF